MLVIRFVVVSVYCEEICGEREGGWSGWRSDGSLWEEGVVGDFFGGFFGGIYLSCGDGGEFCIGIEYFGEWSECGCEDW